MRSNLRLILIYGVILHTAMLAYDVFHPDPFLVADRARERLASIEELSAASGHGGDLTSYLATHGVAGDYLIQAIVYIPFGKYGVIVFQIALLLLSVVALFELTRLISDSSNMAAIAALVYMHLPHALVFPHQLSSEAVSVPLIVISFYFLARYLLDRGSMNFLIASGASLAVAILVRPVLALWPVAVMALLLFIPYKRRMLRASSYGVAALSPLLMWMLFLLAATGTFSMGSSKHDLPHNLYSRAERMIENLPPEERKRATRQYLAHAPDSRHELSLGSYLQFIAAEPGPFGMHLLRDAAVFAGKSSANRLLLDYLNVFPRARNELQRSATGWRKHWEARGFTDTAIYLMTQYPLLIAVNVCAAVACLSFMVLTVIGGGLMISRLPWVCVNQKVTRLLILTFPFYVFLASQVVNAMQSRHRAPAEFALCVLFATAMQYFVTQWNRKRVAHAPDTS